MARIVLSVMPFAGHVAPVTGVVAECIARGHEVTVYTGMRYRARFEAIGARVQPWVAAPDFDEHHPEKTFPAIGRPGFAGLLANLRDLFIRSAEGQAKDLIDLYRSHPWDLLVGDVMALGTGIAAEKLRVPWATASIVPIMLPSADLPPSGLGMTPRPGWIGAVRDAVLRQAFRGVTAPLDRTLRTVREASGLPVHGASVRTAWYSPWLVLATGSPAIEYARSDLPPQFHFVGRLAPSVSTPHRMPAWWADRPAPDRPVVLVTQGTFNTDPRQLLQPTLAALAEEDALVIATTGTAGVDTLPFALPPNARVVGMAPFDEVLPATDIMVTNGGWGGVLETLSHGVPMIVAGRDLDKPEIAARVAWSGAGIDLRTAPPTAASVLDAFRRLNTDAGYRDRAARIADELNRQGGAARAVDLLEELMVGSSPILREADPWSSPG